MLRASEVLLRAANEGRECPVRILDRCGQYGWYSTPSSLCVLGFLLEPVKESFGSDYRRLYEYLAAEYHLTPLVVCELEDRYEGNGGQRRHSLAECAEWVRTQETP